MWSIAVYIPDARSHFTQEDHQMENFQRKEELHKKVAFHLENVLPLNQHVNFCVDNYDH